MGGADRKNFRRSDGDRSRKCLVSSVEGTGIVDERAAAGSKMADRRISADMVR